MVHSTIPPERRDFYVYALLREDGTPFYVGKGKGRRCRTHQWVQKTERTPKASIIRRLLKTRGAVETVKLAEGLTEAEAFVLERETITNLGRHPNGPLHNLTEGGEGATGSRHSEAVRAAQRERMRVAFRDNPEVKQRVRRGHKLLWTSPERSAPVIAAIKAAWDTNGLRDQQIANGRARMSCPKRLASALASMRSPQALEALRVSLKAYHSTDEARAEASRRSKRTWADPVIRARMIASLRAAASSPDARAKRRAMNATPEARARLSAAAKALWADPVTGAAQRALRASPEWRAAHKERLSRPETRQAMTASLLAVWADPEKRARRLESQNRPEVKAAQSKAQVEAWSDPAKRDDQARRTRAHFSNPEAREVQRAKAIAQWADPARRAAAAERGKLQAARRKAAKESAPV